MRLELLRAVGLGALPVLPNWPITDGIERARQLLARAYIDQDRCRPLMKSLRRCRPARLESRKTFALRPRHDCGQRRRRRISGLSGARSSDDDPAPSAPGECALRELQLHHAGPPRRRPRPWLELAVTSLWRPTPWHLAIPTTAPPKRAAGLPGYGSPFLTARAPCGSPRRRPMGSSAGSRGCTPRARMTCTCSPAADCRSTKGANRRLTPLSSSRTCRRISGPRINHHPGDLALDHREEIADLPYLAVTDQFDAHGDPVLESVRGPALGWNMLRRNTPFR